MKVRIIIRLLILCLFLIAISAGYCNAGKNLPRTNSSVKFIANNNQWEKPVLFKAQLAFGTIFLEKATFTYLLVDPKELGKCHHPDSCGKHNPLSETEDQTIHWHAFKMHFNGSGEHVSIVGENKFPEYYNYFIGNDESKWASEVALYHEVKYSNLYPGIDLIAGSKNLCLKYEYRLLPNANPDLIDITYEGADGLFLKNGCLHVKTTVNDIIEQEPFAYQIINCDTIKVRCNFILTNNHVSFRFPDGYRKDLPLVIDPVVMASTYAGTIAGTTYGHTATYDEEGNIYTGGRSFSQGYPTTTGAFITMYAGGTNDVAISKFNPTGSAVIWASYLGGSDKDFAHSLIVNKKNELFVFGTTSSANFPVTTNCFQNTKKDSCDIFITHFNTAGSALKGSTFIGGDGKDGQNRISHNYGDEFRGEIILDSIGNPIVASFTNSVNFPVTTGCYKQTLTGNQDAVIFKLDSNLTTMLYATFLGGTLNDAAYGIKINSAGEIVVAGGTSSADFPVTPGCLHSTFMGLHHDGFICRFSPDLSVLLASTYFGTASFDEIFFVELDAGDHIYVFGQTTGNMTITPGCYGNASSKQFIAKLTPTLDSVIYQTVFGSAIAGNTISPTAFLVDICENVYAAGWGKTDGFPISPNAVQPLTDGNDFYLIVLKKDATSLLYGTYYGANDTWEHVDGGTSRFDKKGIVYEAVCEGGHNFPTTPGAYMTTSNVSWDLAVFKIDFQLSGPKALIDVAPGITGCVPFPVSFLNNSINAVSYLWDFGDGSPVSNVVIPNHVYTVPGIYQVKCIAIDSNACIISDSATLTIHVNGGFSVFIGNDTSQCISDSIILDAGISGSTYNWNTGDSTQTIRVMNSGTYWVSVDKDNCSASDTIQLTLIPYPVVDLGNDKYICNGDHITLTSGHPAIPCQWSTGVTTNQILIGDSGLYAVTVDSLGCMDTDSVFIHVISLNSRLPADTLICAGETATLNPGIPGCQYLWSTGDTTQKVTIVFPGNYWVNIHDSLCNISDTILVKQPGFLSLPEMLDLCGKKFVDLASNIIADSYSWSDGETIAAIEITKAGTYILEVRHGDCIQRDTTTVTGEIGSAELEFPNVFTPNSDGKNDFFQGTDGEIVTLDLKIFNRWGKIVFTTTEPNGRWNGKNNDTAVPEGVYYYLVRYTTICSGDKTFEKSGSVTVLR